MLSTFDRDRDLRENEISSFSETIENLHMKLAENEKRLKDLTEENQSYKNRLEEQLQCLQDRDRELSSMRKQIDKIQADKTQFQNERDYLSQKISLLIQDQNLIAKDSQVS